MKYAKTYVFAWQQVAFMQYIRSRIQIPVSP